MGVVSSANWSVGVGPYGEVKKYGQGPIIVWDGLGPKPEIALYRGHTWTWFSLVQPNFECICADTRILGFGEFCFYGKAELKPSPRRKRVFLFSWKSVTKDKSGGCRKVKTILLSATKSSPSTTVSLKGMFDSVFFEDSLAQILNSEENSRLVCLNFQGFWPSNTLNSVDFWVQPFTIGFWESSQVRIYAWYQIW